MTRAGLRAVAVEHLAEALEARHAVLLEPDGDERPAARHARPRSKTVGPAPRRNARHRTGAARACCGPGSPTSAPTCATTSAPTWPRWPGSSAPTAGSRSSCPDGNGPAVSSPWSRSAPRGSPTTRSTSRAPSPGWCRAPCTAWRPRTSWPRWRRSGGALLDRLVSAQEDERARIADGVHQDQVQVIAAADLRLGVLARRAGELDPALAEDVRFARDAVSGAADRLRALLFELEPPDPTAGLEDSLAEAAAYLLDPVGTAWSVESASSEALTPSHLHHGVPDREGGAGERRPARQREERRGADHRPGRRHSRCGWSTTGRA